MSIFVSWDMYVHVCIGGMMAICSRTPAAMPLSTAKPIITIENSYLLQKLV
jgi:hypothetical protein